MGPTQERGVDAVLKPGKLADRVALVFARGHARRTFERFMRATAKAARVQEQILRRLLDRNAESDFGRTHGFRHIRSYADFARQIPLYHYDDLRPYIERLKRGETRALLGPGQRILMFALTSGTTAEAKYIPVTPDFLRSYRRGWNAFGFKALMDHPEALLRPILQVSSRMDESYTEAGIPCGAITGLMAATQKWLVRRYYAAPRWVAYIPDVTARQYTTMRLAIPRDVAFMITASPATQLQLARLADRYREWLIRDIHDGTLTPQMEVPLEIREALRPMLKPEPEVARRLERIVSQTGRLLPKDYWNLSFLANWTGGTMGLYLRDFPEFFGDTPVRDIGLLASEGRVSIPIEDQDRKSVV